MHVSDTMNKIMTVLTVLPNESDKTVKKQSYQQT